MVRALLVVVRVQVELCGWSGAYRWYSRFNVTRNGSKIGVECSITA